MIRGSVSLGGITGYFDGSEAMCLFAGSRCGLVLLQVEEGPSQELVVDWLFILSFGERLDQSACLASIVQSRPRPSGEAGRLQSELARTLEFVGDTFEQVHDHVPVPPDECGTHFLGGPREFIASSGFHR